MRFRKGVHHPHPPRGRGRGQYHMSDVALRARRRNLSKARQRSASESLIIKRLIWQSCFDGDRRASQRALGRQLGVRPSYVCKVQKRTVRGLDALARGGRITLNDLAEAQRFTQRIRSQEPSLLAPARRLDRGDESRVMLAGRTKL
jgi:hypothetical protein